VGPAPRSAEKPNRSNHSPASFSNKNYSRSSKSQLGNFERAIGLAQHLARQQDAAEGKEATSWPVQYLRAAPQGSTARTPLEERACFLGAIPSGSAA